MMVIIAGAMPRLLATDKDPVILINMQNQPKKDCYMSVLFKI